MPRGFLVKRTKHSNAISYRQRRNSDEDTERYESGSDHEAPVITKFGSPDSGYSVSPVNLIIRENLKPDHVQVVIKDEENNNNNNINNNRNNVNEKDFVSFSPTSSPLTVSTTASSYPSPFYYATFDKLTVSNFSPNNQNWNLNVNQKDSQVSSPSQQNSPNKRRGNNDNDNKVPKKSKAVRKINFDEDKSSPVSGCIIKDISDGEEEGKVVYGDIDSSFNYVEATPEARAELDKIVNKIGDYVCQLCKEFYTDAFKLAQHRCSRIVHVEYRCPECDKVFSCPANLASHRRWHKPRPVNNNKTNYQAPILPAKPDLSNMNDNNDINNMSESVQNGNVLSMTVGDLRASPSIDGQYECETCGKKFRRQAYLRKHVLNHANDRQTNCKFCQKTFPNDALKSKHELLHLNNNNNKELCCNVCKMFFPNKIMLEKHARTHTCEVFNCKYCASTFYSSPGLTRHINKCHPSENRQVILLQFPPSVNRPN
ncbi:insulinoma-associated protein 1a-like [Pecten maximus]|uniref:insulinoma-associated protein 1a-like n=1 Tax=Pecten maximus TaxID=6579 RepID=UPI001458AFB5|nr:insulinoma-associated protein 1a-like [Pecten maximus]